MVEQHIILLFTMTVQHVSSLPKIAVIPHPLYSSLLQPIVIDIFPVSRAKNEAEEVQISDSRENSSRIIGYSEHHWRK